MSEATVTEEQTQEGQLAVLTPPVAERVQVVGKGDYEFEFVQKPLSFIGKLEFFSVMGKALDRAMAGPDGISIADLLEVPDRPTGGLSAEDLKDADTFVKGVTKLLVYAPEMIGDLYCVILQVPQGMRDAVKQVMAANEDDGGLSDEDGFAVIETFIDQNWEVLRDFFTQRIGRLVSKIKDQLPEKEKASKSGKRPSSKPSKSSAQNTESQ